MTITSAASGRYIWDQDTSLSFDAPSVLLRMINMPYFSMLLGADNTTAGTIHIEEAVSTNNGFSPQFEPLVWVPVSSVAVAAGLFPNGQKYFNWPNSISPLPGVFGAWLTGAEAIRLRFEHTGGGSAKQLNVSYFGKSFG